MKVYMDPRLENDYGLYLGFLRELLGRGLLQWTLRPAEFVAFFCVSKKHNKQRLIVDARRSNQHFRPPPGVALAGPELFAAIDHTDAPLYAAETDVEHCFYKFRIQESLGRFFALKGVRAADFDVAHVNGQPVHPSTTIFPCLSVLPMGFTWSLALVQMANEWQVELALRGERSLRLSADAGGCSVPTDGGVVYYVYVDNIGVVGRDTEEVNRCVGKVADHLNSLGLTCHPPSEASDRMETLGVESSSGGTSAASGPLHGVFGGFVPRSPGPFVAAASAVASWRSCWATARTSHFYGVQRCAPSMDATAP